MSTAISLGSPELTTPQPQNSDSSETLIEEMRRVAPPGREALDDITIQTLQGLTQRLIACDPTGVETEFDRYGNTAARNLNIAETKQYEQHVGKTILVTGGTGLIGSTLMRQLVQYAPSRLLSISRGTIEADPLEGAEYAYIDIRDKEALDAHMAVSRPDIVYHVAADKYNHHAETRVAHTLTTNINGTQNVLDAARRYGVEQVVYASTGKATRPFSPEIYAASKKTGEWLMAAAAAKGDMLCAAGRFTHVVDDSYFSKRLQGWIDSGAPVQLHGPDTYFYAQSALESAQLLMNAGVDAQPGALRVHAINNLGMPISLVDMALGLISKNKSAVPIYFYGKEDGYEDKPWPGLYDPQNAGDVSPLVNSFEAPQTESSSTCDMVDVFPLDFQKSPAAEQALYRLQQAVTNGEPNNVLRSLIHELSWDMLDARLGKIPEKVLLRAASRVVKRAEDKQLPAAHPRVDRAILRALSVVGRKA